MNYLGVGLKFSLRKVPHGQLADSMYRTMAKIHAHDVDRICFFIFGVIFEFFLPLV